MNEQIEKAIREGIITDTPEGYVLNKTWPFDSILELDKPLIIRDNTEVGLQDRKTIKAKSTDNKK